MAPIPVCQFKFCFITLILSLSLNCLFAQERLAIIENKLNELSVYNPGLSQKVELSVDDVSIQEFIRGLAIANNLNITVDGSLNIKIVSNFSGVTVQEVLLFLCKKYDLDMSFMGSIMTITAYTPLVVPPPPVVPEVLKIFYDTK